MAKHTVVLVPAIPVTAPLVERTMSRAALKAQARSPFVAVETAVVGVRQVDVVVRVTDASVQVLAITSFARMIHQTVPLQLSPGTLIRMTPVMTSRISRFAIFFSQFVFDVICSRARVQVSLCICIVGPFRHTDPSFSSLFGFRRVDSAAARLLLFYIFVAAFRQRRILDCGETFCQAGFMACKSPLSIGGSTSGIFYIRSHMRHRRFDMSTLLGHGADVGGRFPRKVVFDILYILLTGLAR